MKKLDKCNNCLFFTKEKKKKGLKLKGGYCLCPTLPKDILNKMSTNCEGYIPSNSI